MSQSEIFLLCNPSRITRINTLSSVVRAIFIETLGGFLVTALQRIEPWLSSVKLTCVIRFIHTPARDTRYSIVRRILEQIVRASRCRWWRCKIYRGIAQSRLQRPEFLLFQASAACNHVIRRHTYVPAKIYRSAMGVTCKMRRQSITTGGMHDDRVISNFCLAPRVSQGLSGFQTDEFVQTFFTPSVPIRGMPIG